MRGGLLGGGTDANLNLDAATAYTWGSEFESNTSNLSNLSNLDLSIVNTNTERDAAEEESKQDDIMDVSSHLLYSETWKDTIDETGTRYTSGLSNAGLSFDESVTSLSTLTMSTTFHSGKPNTTAQNNGLSPINEDSRNMPSSDQSYTKSLWDSNCSIYSNSTMKGPKKHVPYNVMHGIPTFMSSMTQIKVTKVSSHPKGEHVLIISEEALLFSYGLNNHGQLGRGGRVRTPSTKTERNFMPNPAIVTPLLENGGKTIDCAAGISHSLVTVKTDGNRVGRLHRREGASTSTSNNNNNNNNKREGIPNEMISYHQLYGFGHNAFFKLGLVDPTPKKKSSSKRKSGKSQSTSSTIDENVTVPRRVALHCEIWPQDENNNNNTTHTPQQIYEENTSSLMKPKRPMFGIFAIACGEHHSAALVRKPTGKIQLYTWGKADECALGHTYRVIEASYQLLENLPFMSKRRKDVPMSGSPNDIVPVPTAVSSLTYDPLNSISSSSSSSNNSNKSLSSRADFTMARDVSKGRPMLEQNEYIDSMALGKSSTFVITSKGRCFSFGTSKEGLLGLGYDVTRCVKPTEIDFTLSSSSSKRTGGDDTTTNYHEGHRPQAQSIQKSAIKFISIGARHALAISQDNVAFAWGVSDNGRLGVSKKGQSSSNNFNNSNKQSHHHHHHRKVIWLPIQIRIPFYSMKSSQQRHPHPPAPHNNSKKYHRHPETIEKVVHVCAGYDNSIFVTEDGKVLSCGRSSGRLGLGETDSEIDILEPTSMFGGLHIWHQSNRITSDS